MKRCVINSFISALACLASFACPTASAQFARSATGDAQVADASLADADSVWMLDECINYALKNNITLKQNVNNYLSGLEDTQQAKAALFPTLSFSTTQGVTNRPFTENQNTVVGSQVYSTSKNSYTGNYNLGANVTLFSGSSLRTAIKQSKLQNSIDSLSIETSKKDLVISIIQAYMQCLYAKEAISVAQSTAESAKASLDRAKELKEAGELSKVDVAQLESQYASDSYQVVTAKTSLDNYKLQLKQLLELGINDEIDVSEPGTEESDVLALLPAKQEVFSNAMEAMPEVKQAMLNVDAANLSIKQAKSGYSPTLSANAAVGSTNVSGAGTSMAEQIKNNMNESLGLTLSIPIFHPVAKLLFLGGMHVKESERMTDNRPCLPVRDFDQVQTLIDLRCFFFLIQLFGQLPNQPDHFLVRINKRFSRIFTLCHRPANRPNQPDDSHQVIQMPMGYKDMPDVHPVIAGRSDLMHDGISSAAIRQEQLTVIVQQKACIVTLGHQCAAGPEHRQSDVFLHGIHSNCKISLPAGVHYSSNSLKSQ